MQQRRFDRTLEPFFFDGLFGIWRAPEAAPRRVWVFCAPFAEEDKSARRVLTETCAALVANGDATLLFSYRGTGDSAGDFAQFTLADWSEDVARACDIARKRAPNAQLCLAGLRLGASLAWNAAPVANVSRLVLIEPLLRGRAILSEINQKKRLRAMVTKDEGGSVALADDDFDGWPISETLRAALENFEIVPVAREKIATLVIGISARAELTTPLQNWAREANAKTLGVKMPAFWNRLDTLSAAPLLETIPQW